jgi:hypothetical protein
MDWTKQADEMIKTWTGAQQKMWESWFELMQSVGTPQSATGIWEKTVDAWRDTVTKALESQVAWTRLWAESVTANAGSSKEVADWAKQVLELTSTWTESQTKLSESWFEMMKKADPTLVAGSWDGEQAKKMMSAWQETAQKAMDAQKQWSTFWTPATSEKKG